jgi:hypothetical protein
LVTSGRSQRAREVRRDGSWRIRTFWCQARVRRALSSLGSCVRSSWTARSLDASDGPRMWEYRACMRCTPLSRRLRHGTPGRRKMPIRAVIKNSIRPELGISGQDCSLRQSPLSFSLCIQSPSSASLDTFCRPRSCFGNQWLVSLLSS